MNKSAVTAGILVLVSAAALLIAYTYFKQTRQAAVPPVLEVPAPTVDSVPNSALSTQPPAREAYIYTLSTGKDVNDTGLAAQRISLGDSKEPARDAMKALIAAKESPLPEGTQLRGIKIDSSKLATVDFSAEFKSHFHGSDSQEAQAVNSILRTLGQFLTISQVQILVDGKPIDSLGEHFEISTPLDVIRPDTKQTSVANEAN